MNFKDVLCSALSLWKEKSGYFSKVLEDMKAMYTTEMSVEIVAFGENENHQKETGKKGVTKLNDDKIQACPKKRGKNHKNRGGQRATQFFFAAENLSLYKTSPFPLNPAFLKEVDHGSNLSSNGSNMSSSYTKSSYMSKCIHIVSIMKEIAAGLLLSVDIVEKFLKNPNEKSAKDISTLFAKISDENVDVNTEIRNSSNSKPSQIKKFEKDDDVTALLTSGSEANETLEASLDRLNSENNRLNHKISELEERHNAIMIELFQATEKVKEWKHVFIDNPGIINDGKRLGYPNFKNCKYATNCSNEDLKDVPKVVISTNDMNEYFDENQKLNYNKKKSEEKRPVEVKSLVISDKRKRNVEMKPEGNIENDTINNEGMRNVEDGQERNDNEEMMRSSDMSPFNEEEVLPFSVQQDESNNYENISLKSAPPISVASSLFVNYKMMLLTIPERLLSSDVTAMKEWARRQFSIEHAQDATEILHQLDRRLIISASNLSVLHSFFESIIRFDLIYIIDGYLVGDYSVFKKRSANEKPRRENHGTRSSYKSLLMSTNDRLSLQYSSTASKPIPKRNNDVSSHRSIQQPSNPLSPVNINVSNPVAKHPHENQSEDFLTQKPKSSITTNTIVHAVHAMNTSFNNASNPLRSSGLPKSIPFSGSNGKKHSKLHNNSQNSEVVLTSREGNWLCSHYKRHCFVKFDCCEQFYPCHRCHNNQSACGNKKLKSRDVKKVKCAYCSNVQEFGEKCTNCGVKFAEYFCALCKHLTGKDDHPYHCEKCGICRVHGDRSFHCDVCGVCLDVQLRGNHKCRENSAHDECCICLEDAFTGCQILPCSHKVHKECANEMIRRGITRCPICRESFAHKLEKKTPSKRRHGGRHK